ncbi:MAG: hypothetical protein LBJ24_04365 [Treponema sp.]|nr:hypothetical protein [Treponema sp.]
MCWYCGAPVTDEEPIGRSLRCSGCGRDLRVCRHCRFYLPGARGDCKESSAEAPQDKERGNFCGWFSLDPRFRKASAGSGRERDSAASAKSAFEDLFK